jgi:hypothetical protein
LHSSRCPFLPRRTDLSSQLKILPIPNINFFFHHNSAICYPGRARGSIRRPPTGISEAEIRDIPFSRSHPGWACPEKSGFSARRIDNNGIPFSTPAFMELNMTTMQLQQRARDSGHGACTVHTSRSQLVRIIQLRQGGEPCFLTEKRYLCTSICEWSRECRKLVAQWMR